MIINLEFKSIPDNQKILDSCRFKYQILILLSGDLKYEKSSDEVVPRGDSLLLDSKYDGTKIKENVYSKGQAQFAVLRMGMFEKLFAGNIDDVLSRVKFGHESRLFTYVHPQRKDKDKIKCDNLKVLKVLGFLIFS